MKSIIAAGHVCLDITPVISSERPCTALGDLLVPGKLVQTGKADVHTGGSVSNTGLALKLLGNDVRLLGKVGSDAFGTMVQQMFADYGVGGLLVDPDSSTSYSVVLAVPGIDRIFLHNPGANDTFTGDEIPEESLQDVVLFHFGYPPLMKRMYENNGALLVSMMQRMKAHGIATSLDLAAVDPDSEAGRADWTRILQDVLPWVDLFVPSFEELCFMLDRPRYDCLAQRGGDMTASLDIAAEVVPLADKLLTMGCKVILIKCGTSGMYLRTASKETLLQCGSRLELNAELWADHETVQPCFQPDIVRSGTGAGDTSIAAFLTAVLRGYRPADCAALAAAEGACCVTSYDALSGLETMDALEARISSGWATLA